MANKRIIELQERTSIDMGDWLIVDSSTSTRKLSLATLFNYMTYSSMIFVTELPTTDISTTTIYLVPHSGSTTDWDEYIYRENEWVLIGTSTIDLSAIYQTNDKAAIQNNDIPWYGTSSTAAATTAKIATTTDSNFALVTGAKVSIKFTYTNTASAPTLNVDDKGAKSIKAYGTTAPSVWWKAGDVVEFTYDGTNWIMGATSGKIEQLNSDLPYSAFSMSDKTNWAGIDARYVSDCVVTIALRSNTYGMGAHLKIDDTLVAENRTTDVENYTYILKGTHLINTATTYSILFMTITPLDI